MIDNKNEEFPIVDEMGNILGVVTRGHAHDGSKILHPVVHLLSEIPRSYYLSSF